MPLEIERKFLVAHDGWKPASRIRSIRQGYLSEAGNLSVRVRVQDNAATLTVKGERAGITRDEYEYPVPLDDALRMLDLCPLPPIVKKRHELTIAGKLWQIDVFEGALAGLVIAEVELTSEHESFVRPSWLGREVTDDRRYRNSALVQGGREVMEELFPRREAVA